MRGAMSDFRSDAYRVYYFGEKDAIIGVDELDCSTDEEALAILSGMSLTSRVELWKGQRLLSQFVGQSARR
jgi:hypothetical protein